MLKAGDRIHVLRNLEFKKGEGSTEDITLYKGGHYVITYVGGNDKKRKLKIKGSGAIFMIDPSFFEKIL